MKPHAWCRKEKHPLLLKYHRDIVQPHLLPSLPHSIIHSFHHSFHSILFCPPHSPSLLTCYPTAANLVVLNISKNIFKNIKTDPTLTPTFISWTRPNDTRSPCAGVSCGGPFFLVRRLLRLHVTVNSGGFLPSSNLLRSRLCIAMRENITTRGETEDWPNHDWLSCDENATSSARICKTREIKKKGKKENISCWWKYCVPYVYKKRMYFIHS